MAQDEVDFAAVWNNALNTVADTMSAPQNAFLRLARLVGLIDNTVLLAVPNDFTKGVLEERLAAPLTDALSDQLGRDLHLAITVDPSLAGTGAAGASSPGSSEPHDGEHDLLDLTAVEGRESLADLTPPARRRPTAAVRCPARPRPSRRDIFRVGPSGPTTAPRESRLNPKYTFETFVIGSQQPVRPRRRGRGRRGAGQGVQPAVHLRRVRPGQDPPAARDRPLRPQPLPRRPGALRELRGVHQRLHQLASATTRPRRSSAATATSTSC